MNCFKCTACCLIKIADLSVKMNKINFKTKLTDASQEDLKKKRNIVENNENSTDEKN